MARNILDLAKMEQVIEPEGGFHWASINAAHPFYFLRTELQNLQRVQ